MKTEYKLSEWEKLNRKLLVHEFMMKHEFTVKEDLTDIVCLNTYRKFVTYKFVEMTKIFNQCFECNIRYRLDELNDNINEFIARDKEESKYE